MSVSLVPLINSNPLCTFTDLITLTISCNNLNPKTTSSGSVNVTNCTIRSNTASTLLLLSLINIHSAVLGVHTKHDVSTLTASTTCDLSSLPKYFSSLTAWHIFL
ncbi:hypothetical protein AX774_g978 [Zancudomyces culisetae]|uniref:Uncharacterized protein n=1 Tax=Zancudomyces culisetae TaxID=1213189 RepID=A0A1R1PX25_ZANCU|nr:hypothetical protein AX774_g978 [Zancudomyces culisetae]|eukprot:OMH85488.1 hypothetical protein AX774_g978 [Zancudomyces culisetae]